MYSLVNDTKFSTNKRWSWNLHVTKLAQIHVMIIGRLFIDLACPGFCYIVLRMYQRASSACGNETVLMQLPNLISYICIIYLHTSYTVAETRIIRTVRLKRHSPSAWYSRRYSCALRFRMRIILNTWRVTSGCASVKNYPFVGKSLATWRARVAFIGLALSAWAIENRRQNAVMLSHNGFKISLTLWSLR